MRICFLQQCVLNGLVAQIRCGKFITELRIFSLKRSGSINSGVLCIRHLQLIINEHIDIVFNRLRCKLLGIILIIEIHEFAEPDITSVDSHQHLIAGNRRCRENTGSQG